MKSTYRMTLSPVTLETAEAGVRETLEKTKQQMGMIPNMYTRMGISPGALDTYLSGYARFRKGSGFTPAEQEVVFLAVSLENECGYCVAAHSVVADGPSKLARPVTDALRAGTEIPDPRLRGLAAFTRTMVAKRGRPSPEDVAAFAAAGFGERHVLEIVLAIAVKTISNYVNHLFDTPVDAAFAGRVWTPQATGPADVAA